MLQAACSHMVPTASYSNKTFFKTFSQTMVEQRKTGNHQEPGSKEVQGQLDPQTATPICAHEGLLAHLW